MIDIEGRVIGEVFASAARTFADNDFLVVPRDPDRTYAADGLTITYAGAQQIVCGYIDALRAAGYGHGHRIAILLENRPEMLLFKLAANALGISWVPVNPDYKAAEIAFLLEDSRADLIISLEAHTARVAAAAGQCVTPPPVLGWEQSGPRCVCVPRGRTATAP